jgi:hypothetical protein
VFRTVVVLSVPALLLWQTLGAESLSLEHEARLVVDVRVQDFAGVPRGVLRPALSIARAIFRRAGIETRWLNCTPGLPDIEPDCRAKRGPTTKVLRILSPEMMAKLTDLGAEYGRAHLISDRSRGTYASVYWPRVQALADGPARPVSHGLDMGSARLREARILGYVFAHELAHLFGVHHGKTGVMSGPWSPSELLEVLRGTLRFRRDERDRIKRRLYDGLNSSG